jgi:hypothetical protein
MRKLSAKTKQRARRRAKQAWVHNLKRRKNNNKTPRPQSAYRIPKSPSSGITIRKYNIDAPAVFNLSSNFDEVMSFFFRLRQASLVKKRRFFSINFKTIIEISPAAALILTAEIDRWRRLSRMQLRPAELRKWHPDVRRLLNEMGFFEILGIDNPCTDDDKIKNDSLKFIRCMTDNISNGSIVFKLQMAIEALAGPVEAAQAMYEGVTEAMVNCVDHAYPKDKIFSSQIYRRWWMSGSYHKEQGRITVMVYDMGVGIPTTLPNSDFWAIVSGFLSKLQLSATDANIIRGAMEIGKTRTGLENRGYGLYDIQQFIQRSGKGVLRIISQKGEYTYFHSGKEITKDHKYPLVGTLIAWEIYTKDDTNDPE